MTEEQYKFLDSALDDLMAQLAAQRRTIATLRSRLQRGSRGRQNFRGKHHKHGKRFCICGQCATRTFDALNEGHGSAWQMNHHRILHGQRIAAIRNFGALPSGPACWMCSHDSTRGQMTKDDNGPIHYECARLLAEFAADSGLEEEASAFLMRCK